MVMTKDEETIIERIRDINSKPDPKISEILKKYMNKYEMTGYSVAKAIYVPPYTIYNLLHDRGRITAELSLLLAKLFNLSDSFFLCIQTEIEIRKYTASCGNRLDGITPYSEWIKNYKK